MWVCCYMQTPSLSCSGKQFLLSFLYDPCILAHWCSAGISVTYFKLCCYAKFYCKSRLPDKLVSVIAHLQNVVTLWAVHWEHTLVASMSSRQMTRHATNVLGNSWPMTNPISMQQRMNWKIFSICILVAGLDIFFLRCSAWEHWAQRGRGWGIRKEVSKVIWSGNGEREVWRLILVMCRDSGATMSAAVTAVFYLTSHYLPWHWPLRQNWPPFPRNQQKSLGLFDCCASVTCEQFFLPSVSPTCSPCSASISGSYPHWARYPRLRRLYWGLLNLLNAALQCSSARLGTAPALCWHSSNPLWGGDGILVYCARALSVRENKRAWRKSVEGKRKYNGTTTAWLDPLKEGIRWWNRVFLFYTVSRRQRDWSKNVSHNTRQQGWASTVQTRETWDERGQEWTRPKMVTLGLKCTFLDETSAAILTFMSLPARTLPGLCIAVWKQTQATFFLQVMLSSAASRLNRKPASIGVRNDN